MHLTRWYCETQPVCRWMLMFTDDYILCLLVQLVGMLSSYCLLISSCEDIVNILEEIVRTETALALMKPCTAAAG